MEVSSDRIALLDVHTKQIHGGQSPLLPLPCGGTCPAPLLLLSAEQRELRSC